MSLEYLLNSGPWLPSNFLLSTEVLLLLTFINKIINVKFYDLVEKIKIISLKYIVTVLQLERNHPA